jgi:hypothetical protein
MRARICGLRAARNPGPSIVGNHFDDAKRARDAREEVLEVFGFEC